MAIFTSKDDENANTRLTELRLLKSQVQTSERHRQLQREQQSTRDKVGNDRGPESVKKIKQKRNFFKWLFQTNVPTNRKVAPPPPPTFRVKIPIVYRNGEHRGVIVGGLRVPFSRPMQANRRFLLVHGNDVNCRIPEDIEMLLDFPDRLRSEQYEAEQQRQQQEKKKLKADKLERELAK
ncbi:hypothetical protein PHYBOEH_006357 [Phytophthora boehmeriae]|uniref:Uncharacterized protein n=1 Tax=Phytophthora boehmeriae TaxID=109152 RepID=A0A8T1WKA9_9STRA|nr:hypothetical protein PHYBOEH_006357 [Phytophthora boehmeriae]